jgi:two-component system sensor histidine kinase/response regulator
MNLNGERHPVNSALIVDDNWFNRDICRIALSSVGYQLTEADNGAAALNLLAERTFDLMVLDLDMPVVGGLTVLNRVRSETRHDRMRVIVLTAHSHMATGDVDTEADFVMHKPINIVEFAAFADRLKDSSVPT